MLLGDTYESIRWLIHSNYHIGLCICVLLIGISGMAVDSVAAEEIPDTDIDAAAVVGQ
jgi:hypothetical protein